MPQRPSYVPVTVQSTSTGSFLFIRNDLWQGLGADEPSRRTEFWRQRQDQQIGVGAQIQLREGQQYLLFPVCADQPAWTKVLRHVPDGAGTVTVNC